MTPSSENRDSQGYPEIKNQPSPSETGEIPERDVSWLGKLKQTSAEIAALRILDRKRRRETAKLRLMFYSGLGGLALLFLLFGVVFQQRQIHNLEANQLRMKEEIERTKKVLADEIQRLDDNFQGKVIEEMQERLLAKDAQLKDALGRIKDALSTLDLGDVKTLRLIEQFEKEAGGLMNAHDQYKQEELEKLTKKSALRNRGLSSKSEIKIESPQNGEK